VIAEPLRRWRIIQIQMRMIIGDNSVAELQNRGEHLTSIESASSPVFLVEESEDASAAMMIDTHSFRAGGGDGGRGAASSDDIAAMVDIEKRRKRRSRWCRCWSPSLSSATIPRVK